VKIVKHGDILLSGPGFFVGQGYILVKMMDGFGKTQFRQPGSRIPSGLGNGPRIMFPETPSHVVLGGELNPDNDRVTVAQKGGNSLGFAPGRAGLHHENGVQQSFLQKAIQAGAL
jgi:hypothetical protein